MTLYDLTIYDNDMIWQYMIVIMLTIDDFIVIMLTIDLTIYDRHMYMIHFPHHLKMFFLGMWEESLTKHLANVGGDSHRWIFKMPSGQYCKEKNKYKIWYWVGVSNLWHHALWIQQYTCYIFKNYCCCIQII